MRQPRDLNATSAATLGLLHRLTSATAGELARAAEADISPFWGITRSQIFRELPLLAGRGLVGAGDTGPRGSVPYHLTDAGREAFGAWLVGAPHPQQPREELLLRIGFGQHLGPEDLELLLDRHRKVHAARLAHHETERAALAEAGEPYRLVTCEYAIRYERMVLSWIEDLPKLLLTD
ncbi:PadR family transcriptional regulator [Longispora fulva]|uniref:DNA-binding PadR family transcriptional regulator n=1 Tax=Longispora fulva TaxID=619741 RepID=A0A8J7GEH5_9ACTN|nr:PadR family transcriptional regulator [Longispora fulva]MBG6139143.1 DNA-binding PadR family transcriptional regulator [Longispora fulva]